MRGWWREVPATAPWEVIVVTHFDVAQMNRPRVPARQKKGT